MERINKKKIVDKLFTTIPKQWWKYYGNFLMEEYEVNNDELETISVPSEMKFQTLKEFSSENLRFNERINFNTWFIKKMVLKEKTPFKVEDIWEMDINSFPGAWREKKNKMNGFGDLPHPSINPNPNAEMDHPLIQMLKEVFGDRMTIHQIPPNINQKENILSIKNKAGEEFIIHVSDNWIAYREKSSIVGLTPVFSGSDDILDEKLYKKFQSFIGMKIGDIVISRTSRDGSYEKMDVEEQKFILKLFEGFLD